MSVSRLLPLAIGLAIAAPAAAQDPKDFPEPEIESDPKAHLLMEPELALDPKAQLDEQGAQWDAGASDASDAVAEAHAMIRAHNVNLRVGCGIPVPATYSAPGWQQRAAAAGREQFNQCLSGVMAREEGRLRALESRLRELSGQYPSGDWDGVISAMSAKWDELDSLNDRLNTKVMWADTAERVLDTFTGPGAPFDANRPAFNPYLPPQPYTPGFPRYRRDSSVSAPGMR